VYFTALSLRTRTPGARAFLPVTRCQSSGPLGALLRSPALDVRLMTALQVLQVRTHFAHVSAHRRRSSDEEQASAGHGTLRKKMCCHVGLRPGVLQRRPRRAHPERWDGRRDAEEGIASPSTACGMGLAPEDNSSHLSGHHLAAWQDESFLAPGAAWCVWANQSCDSVA
jgi:hypothetical protein